VSISAYQYANAGPFGMSLAPDGSVWMTNGGGFNGTYTSSVVRYQLVNGVPQLLTNVKPVGKALKGLAVDSQGNAWVTSQGDNSVYVINPNGAVMGPYGGGGVGGPWGATVDGDDNVWVSNFGPLMPGSNWTNGSISKLCRFKPGACPPGVLPGQPLSPSTRDTPCLPRAPRCCCTTQ
jgi:streptogramin lyase